MRVANSTERASSLLASSHRFFGAAGKSGRPSGKRSERYGPNGGSSPCGRYRAAAHVLHCWQTWSPVAPPLPSAILRSTIARTAAALDARDMSMPPQSGLLSSARQAAPPCSMKDCIDSGRGRPEPITITLYSAGSASKGSSKLSTGGRKASRLTSTTACKASCCLSSESGAKRTCRWRRIASLLSRRTSMSALPSRFCPGSSEASSRMWRALSPAPHTLSMGDASMMVARPVSSSNLPSSGFCSNLAATTDCMMLSRRRVQTRSSKPLTSRPIRL